MTTAHYDRIAATKLDSKGLLRRNRKAEKIYEESQAAFLRDGHIHGASEEVEGSWL